MLDKAKRIKQDLTFSLLTEYSFEASFELSDSSKNSLHPFYVNYKGDEDKFAHFLDNSNIDWWHKNGDNGKDALGIEYIDYQDMPRVFYPDFIIRKGDEIFIFDTKSGFTAREATEKAEALYKYCQNNKGVNVFGTLSQTSHSTLQVGTLNLLGGIVQLAKTGFGKFTMVKAIMLILITGMI
ncbi:hypothetical protein CRYPA_1854 [uncultured Candidatus Thioglobus sp.]|nr:hypothetical protein CRYPA_1854 [uncultured Candidatus Thioglobus sp.]